MALSAFDDKASPPTDQSLDEMLGRAGPLWARLKDDLQQAYGPLIEQWNFSGKAYGWSFRLIEPNTTKSGSRAAGNSIAATRVLTASPKNKKRVLIYMTPCRAHFLASFALGEKACRAAQQSGLPPAVLAIIDAAPKYAEGRGVRIPVRNKRDLQSVETLAAIKHAN